MNQLSIDLRVCKQWPQTLPVKLYESGPQRHFRVPSSLFSFQRISVPLKEEVIFYFGRNSSGLLKIPPFFAKSDWTFGDNTRDCGNFTTLEPAWWSPLAHRRGPVTSWKTVPERALCKACNGTFLRKAQVPSYKICVPLLHKWDEVKTRVLKDWYDNKQFCYKISSI